MKAVRMQNMITSGPQSNILDGATWDEAKRTSETVVDGNVTRTTEQVMMVGAASKGIIQRDYQHNATVYKSAYSKNPFDNVTAQELEEYKQYVLKKERGEPGKYKMLNVPCPDTIRSLVDELPEHVRHLLLEPVSDQNRNPRQVTSPTNPKSPLQSPTSDLEGTFLEFGSAFQHPRCDHCLATCFTFFHHPFLLSSTTSYTKISIFTTNTTSLKLLP